MGSAGDSKVCVRVCVCGEHFSTGEVYIKGKWHEKAQNKIEQ